MTVRILLLGGTTEARKLAERLADDTRFDVLVSLAGRTQSPKPSPVPVRTGGFGSHAGLAAFLREHPFDVIVDATHPFAAQMSANAVHAAKDVGVPLVRLERAPWMQGPRDVWQGVASLEEAVDALANVPQNVFLGVGRQSLVPFAAKPQHHYVIRVIDPPDVPAAMVQHEIITGLGPFRIEDDIALFRDKRIDVVVTKNSGGTATASKIVAARELGLPVIIVERPQLPASEDYAARTEMVEDVVSWLRTHYLSLTKRSV